ncbi:YciI family protein [Flavobacterium sp.]|uniref:YciI family protein n=1 Tax=Flavobacterium sp. TaxID=239 RepID=UPI0035270289
MKNYLIVILLGMCFSCVSIKVENTKNVASKATKPATKHETFSYKDGDTTYVMQKYFLVLLKKGANRNQNKEEIAEIQKKHLAHISWLAKQGYISVAGPSENHDVIAGFLLFNTETQQQADSLAKLDPAVKAGRLEVESLPWWAAKGSALK